MKSTDILSVLLASLYLLIYTFLAGFPETQEIALLMFVFSPLVMLAMVLIVLFKGKYKGGKLNHKEFGYADKIDTIIP